MSTYPPDWVETNRRSWDERVPIHVASEFYDVDGFRAGKPSVQPFEVEELGPLGDLDLVHLQCHFGMDMLDLVRLHPGLRAVGLDFSSPAVEAAGRLAEELNLAERARFVASDVMHASDVLEPGSFDVVYTGKGALCWLSDLPGWAAQCARLLKPGGFLYVSEFHPIGNALDVKATGGVGDDYFRTDPWVDEYEGSYADADAVTEHNLTYCWNHTIASTLGAVMGAGLRLQFFHEFDHTLFKLTDWLVEGEDGRFDWPTPDKRLPLMFSLKAFKG